MIANDVPVDVELRVEIVETETGDTVGVMLVKGKKEGPRASLHLHFVVDLEGVVGHLNLRIFESRNDQVEELGRTR